MNNSILSQGDKLLITHRRLFDTDESRYFIGEVVASNDNLVQVTGFTWLKNSFNDHFHKKDGERSKIISLASGTFIVYKLDYSADYESLEIVINKEEGCTRLKDKNGFIMDITEKNHQQ